MARLKANRSRADFSIQVFNRQKTRGLNSRAVKQIAWEWLASLPGGPAPRRAQLGIHFVAAPEMACLNETFLQHSGSTDVITFDYGDEAAEGGLCGEIYISVDDAVRAAPRFRVPWTKELARYLAHGLLHLRGFDDHSAAKRRVMKKWENHLLRRLSRQCNWAKLERA